MSVFSGFSSFWLFFPLNTWWFCVARYLASFFLATPFVMLEVVWVGVAKSYGPIAQELPSEVQNQLKLWVDLYHDGGLWGGSQSQMSDLWCEPGEKNQTNNVIFANFCLVHSIFRFSFWWTKLQKYYMFVSFFTEYAFARQDGQVRNFKKYKK